MEPISEERLAEVRKIHETPPFVNDLARDGGRILDLAGTARELLTEVDRLRAELAKRQTHETLPDPKGGCSCWLPSEQWDTSYYGIPEPGSQAEYDPACPEHSHHVYDPRQGEWVDAKRQAQRTPLSPSGLWDEGAA